MSKEVHCAECGESLPSCWPKALCSRCALDELLDLQDTALQIPPRDEPPSPSVNQPSHSVLLQGEIPGRFGDYDLSAIIARGGMGNVYRARQVSLNRIVALKMILSGQFASKQEVLRFRAEAEAAANLHHPNIVAIYETGESGGRHYFSMDYVQGRNLSEIAVEGPLPAKRAARYVSVVAYAIHYAHEHGVLHRDLKPSNVMIDENDQPRVTDFGLAKRARGDFGLTVTGQLLGSPNFMPPEQTSGKSGKIGPTSDVYGLGAILYHLLTGRPPFQAETIEEVLRQLHEADPVAPRLMNPGIPLDLETICLRCLEKEPVKRYQTARSMADELDRFLRDEPIQARPVRTPEKIWRWCRRKPVLAALIGLLHVVGIGGLSGIVWQWQRVEEKKEELETNLYFSQVALAHRESAAEPPDVRAVEELLDRCPPRFRNWEWDYLRRRRYSKTLVLADPASNVVYGVAFSSDGRHLATAGGDGNVRLWNIAEAKAVQTLSVHKGLVGSVAFSPSNPHWIASAGSDGQLVLSDWRTGDKIHAWPSTTAQGTGVNHAVAFSPDGLTLAGPGNGGEVLLRNAVTGELLHKLPGHEQVGGCVAFSPNGRWLATGSAQGNVNLWDVPNGRLVVRLGPSGAPLVGISYSQDGRRLAVAYVHGFVSVWNMETHRLISSYRVSSTVLGGLAFHPSGDRVFTAGFGGLLTVSESTTRRQVLVFRELSKRCSGLAISLDGHRLAAASRDGVVHVWDATPLRGTEDRSLRTLDYPGQVWALASSTDGRAIAVGGEPRLDAPAGLGAPIFVWRNLPLAEPWQLPGHAIVVFSLAFDPSGRFLASAGDHPLEPGNARARVWDLESGREAFPVEAFAGDHVLFSVAYSRDGEWMVGGGGDCKIKVWHGTTGKMVGVVGEHAGFISKLAFSPDPLGRYLASIGDDDVVKVWDATRLGEPQNPLHRFVAQSDDKADAIGFSPSGNQLAVTTVDDLITIHELQGSDRVIPLVSRGHRPRAVAFSPNGLWVASGGKDCAVNLWNART